MIIMAKHVKPVVYLLTARTGGKILLDAQKNVFRAGLTIRLARLKNASDF